MEIMASTLCERDGCKHWAIKHGSEGCENEDCDCPVFLFDGEPFRRPGLSVPDKV